MTKGAARCAAMLIALTIRATQGVDRAAECVVRGSAVTLAALTVHPKDDAPFQIGISKMPVTATIHKHKGSLLAERSHWCEASLLNAMIAAGACPNPRAAGVSPRAPELMRKIVSDASVQEEQAIVPAQV